MTALPILSVENVSKTYAVRGGSSRGGTVQALDSVSLSLEAGQSLAIVGESGSGKSTLANIVVGLLQPSSGSVLFRGRPRLPASGRAARVQFAKQVQMVFQDPYTSLDPRHTGRDGLDELLRMHTRMPRAQRQERIDELGAQVGLSARHLDAVPRDLSGGQRQRLAITRALAIEPEILVLDEAVSALDVSVQAQLLNLLSDIRKETGLAYLFVSHDLGVVRGIADRVVVMEGGRIVEHGPTEDVFTDPQHPYTRTLLDAIPRLTARKALT